MECWNDGEEFLKLLVDTGKDQELTDHLIGMFSKESSGNQFLIISKEELKDFLREETNKFYSW